MRSLLPLGLGFLSLLSICFGSGFLLLLEGKLSLFLLCFLLLEHELKCFLIFLNLLLSLPLLLHLNELLDLEPFLLLLLLPLLLLKSLLLEDALLFPFHLLSLLLLQVLNVLLPLLLSQHSALVLLSLVASRVVSLPSFLLFYVESKVFLD